MELICVLFFFDILYIVYNFFLYDGLFPQYILSMKHITVESLAVTWIVLLRLYKVRMDLVFPCKY